MSRRHKPGDELGCHEWCNACNRWTAQTCRVLAHAVEGVRYALTEWKCGECKGWAV